MLFYFYVETANVRTLSSLNIPHGEPSLLEEALSLGR